jgi:hypothetical protein
MCGALRCKDGHDKCDSRFVEGTDTHATLEYLFKNTEDQISFCQDREEIFERFHDHEKMIF